MSKVIDVKYCEECRYLRFSSGRGIFCAKDNRSILDTNRLPPDCPLPDWPRVSMKQLKTGIAYIFSGGTGGVTYIDGDLYPLIVSATEKMLRSIGVEVVENTDEPPKEEV